MRAGRLVTAVAALAVIAMTPAAAGARAEDCAGITPDVCVAQDHRQVYLQFTPGADPGLWRLVADETGAAVLTATSQAYGTAAGIVPRGTLQVSVDWGSTPQTSTATVRGTIPTSGTWALGDVAIDLAIQGIPGDAAYRGAGCSVSDRASAGNGRARSSDAVGDVGPHAFTADEPMFAQLRRYDVCTAVR
ncbi:MAG TPA: hypothetical protein VNE62_10600 [Actinomycetota bacterium]|nr:hypothetical protein [Actinomycetota bacterium]